MPEINEGFSDIDSKVQSNGHSELLQKYYNIKDAEDPMPPKDVLQVISSNVSHVYSPYDVEGENMQFSFDTNVINRAIIQVRAIRTVMKFVLAPASGDLYSETHLLQKLLNEIEEKLKYIEMKTEVFAKRMAETPLHIICFAMRTHIQHGSYIINPFFDKDTGRPRTYEHFKTLFGKSFWGVIYKVLLVLQHYKSSNSHFMSFPPK